jgi:hypothetical protein
VAWGSHAHEGKGGEHRLKPVIHSHYLLNPALWPRFSLAFSHI